MSKINVSPRTMPGPTTHEGARAKRIGAEAQLRRSVMACLLWEDQFYESGKSIADRIAQGVAAVPLATAAALAIEAREQMHLRHVPLLMVREMARGGGGAVVGNTLARVIQRPDELSEFVAMYWKDGRVPLSKQVKRGLAEAFRKFDAYALSKWNRDAAVKLRDVLFMVHPKPTDEGQQAIWDSLVDGSLTPPDTWEVALSGGADKLATWTRLLEERKLGGLALLRNLRNMEQAGVAKALVRQAINGNPFSRVLPFRFVAAARHAPDLEPELEQAMFRALEGVRKLPGKTALLVDHSGSMRSPLARRSELDRFDTACALAMLLREVCADVDVIPFSTWAALVPPRRGFALADAIAQAGNFGGTYTEMAKRAADGRGYDRIIIVTDEQSHQTLSDPLDRTPGYVVNVASAKNGIGYGRWTHIDGWSDNVVRYIQESETGAD